MSSQNFLEVTYVLQYKDIGWVNHNTEVYIYIMLSWTSAAVVILVNS